MADLDLNAAALAEGLAVEDPNSHPWLPVNIDQASPGRPNRKRSDPADMKRFAGDDEFAGYPATECLPDHTLVAEQAVTPPIELVPAREADFTIERQAGPNVYVMADPQGMFIAMALSTSADGFSDKR